MMKQSLTILFSVLIFLSNINLTVARHYCGGDLVSSELLLGNEISDCGMELQKSNCSEETQAEKLTKNCCENEMFSVGSDAEFERLLQTYQLDSSFIQAYIQVLFDYFFPSENPSPLYDIADSKPPGRSLYLLYQIFLI